MPGCLAGPLLSCPQGSLRGAWQAEEGATGTMPSGGGEIIIIALTSAGGLLVRKALTGPCPSQAHLLSGGQPLDCEGLTQEGVWPPGAVEGQGWGWGVTFRAVDISASQALGTELSLLLLAHWSSE